MMSHSKSMNFEEYEKEYAATGRLYLGLFFKKPKRLLNKKQLRTAYQSHLRKIEKIAEKQKQKNKEDSLDKIIRDQCFERDRGYCQAMALFNGTEFTIFKALANSMELKLDAAHVFGKAAFPHMRYLPDNVVIINRVSHNWLDASKSPVDGKPITVAEKVKWWKRIVGIDRYSVLENASKGE